MIVLTIRTDSPEAQVGLYQEDRPLQQISWLANRELAETIHIKIRQLLADSQQSFNDLAAIICYKGPGSFTGLRIGIAVANALAEGLSIPAVGSNGPDWISSGLKLLAQESDGQMVVPEYGAPVHITMPRK